ncbi:MAG: nitrate reductase molybdenum cofactor assembly chaperone [Burkholderiales bacterium]|nr:nitrate reductase molybdenum cofactor assembly chaperone [Burkholderiales bacterium]
MKTFKVLAALLSYPELELTEAVDELEQALDGEKLLSRGDRRALDALFTALRDEDLLELQEQYVGLFDRVRSLSLHLFEHVHGESRDRGQAMVDLKQVYQSHGLALASNELPDFLPAFLEYLSFVPVREAQELLVDSAHILEILGARLKKRGSPYSAVLYALVTLSGAKLTPTVVDESEIRKEDDPATIDKVWEEEPAFGGKPKPAEVSVIQFYKGAAR